MTLVDISWKERARKAEAALTQAQAPKRKVVPWKEYKEGEWPFECDHPHSVVSQGVDKLVCYCCWMCDEADKWQAEVTKLMEAIEPWAEYGTKTSNEQWQRAKRVYEQVKEKI